TSNESLGATVVAVIVCTVVAFLLAKLQFPGKPLAQGISLLPMVMPPTVLGYALLVSIGQGSIFGRWYHTVTGQDLVFEFTGIVIAASIAAVPFYIWQAQVAFAEV